MKSPTKCSCMAFMFTHKKITLLFFLLLIILFGCLYQPNPIQAQAGNAYDMINGINELRVDNGLAPLSINGFLMASAQSHADWINATRTYSHLGVDGSYPIDRALAVGYGGGAAAFVTENFANGINLSVLDCIYVSWDDPDHMGNMLTTWHNEIGAGVSIDAQNRVTYVVNFGHVSGSVPPPQTTQVGELTPAPYIIPLQTATPNPDGSIYHTVVSGQFLVTIADAYEIPLEDLLALNNLSIDDTIFPGDELIIRLGKTPEPTEVVILTPTQTNTIRPSQTPRPSLTPILTATTIPKPDKEPGLLERIFSGYTLYLGIGLVIVSIIGIILLIISSRRIR